MTREFTGGTKTRSYVGLSILGVIGIVGLMTFFGSWYKIYETERGVVLRNGAFVDVVGAGLHFKWPFIDDVVKIDMQTHTHTWKDMESYSADQQPAHFRVSITLHVAADKVNHMYTRFSGDRDAAITRLVAPHVAEKTKVVFGTFTAERAITQRGQLNAKIMDEMRAALAYDPVFEIESVQVEDIAFSKAYTDSVEKRMTAEVEVQQYRQQLEREKVQAEINVTKAKGEADAVVARAEADAKSRILQGNAEAQAIAAKGEALAKNPGLTTLVQAERWDGKLPGTMIPGGSIPMLNLSGLTK